MSVEWVRTSKFIPNLIETPAGDNDMLSFRYLRLKRRYDTCPPPVMWKDVADSNDGSYADGRCNALGVGEAVHQDDCGKKDGHARAKESEKKITPNLLK